MDLKCKSCGFPLVVKPGEVVAKCEACGLVNTLPSMDTDQKILRCNHANDYRQNCEFDQAAQLFQDILKEDAREPEAYWGLVLCKYGVQYVDDPKDGHRVPTCNRIQSIPIMADVDYKKALTYAEDSRLGVYQYQAKEIDEIQKKIIEISSHEKPYDVFICYKELDNLTGQRTQDSVLAQELYRELTDYHLRVFFARITLREKLGVEYEPYIYAALTSAPVMIHVTTSYNNSNAPWVKNEWSRYLSLKNSGSDKSFTVAYKSLNPDVALPKEFSGKQASDLSRVGAMQEIAEWASQAVKQYKEKQGRGHEDEEALKLTISKAFEHLAIGNRNQAEQMFRACLEVDKTCAEAYLGLVMTRRNYMNRRQLGTGMVSLTDDLNFNLAVQYADEDLRRELEAAEAQIQNRIREKREADARKAEEERLEAERKAEAERRRKEQERLEKERVEQKAKEEEKRKRKQEETRKKEEEKRKRIGIIICVAAVACFAFYLNVVLPARRKAERNKKRAVMYEDAMELLDANQYDSAYSQFENLAEVGYKDSRQMLTEVYSSWISDAKKQLLNGEYQSCISTLESLEKRVSDYDVDDFYQTKYRAYLGLNEYTLAYECLGNYSDPSEVESAMQEIRDSSIQNATVGSTVYMGQFEQDSNTDNGMEPIEWKVLDIQDGKAFLISDKILTYKVYNEEVEGYVFAHEEKDFIWEFSYIRDWLNTEFYNAAFSESDKARIIKTTYKSEGNGGENHINNKIFYTSENVTLLSDEEVKTYFGEKEDAEAGDTQSAQDERIATVWRESWFLRSSYEAGETSGLRMTHRVTSSGDVDWDGWQNCELGIRPAMWISIS